MKIKAGSVDFSAGLPTMSEYDRTSIFLTVSLWEINLTTHWAGHTLILSETTHSKGRNND